MAKVTCKCLTYAKYSSGGSGSAVVYTGGKQKIDYMAKWDLTETRENTKEHADGHLIDEENALTAVALALEIVNNDDDIKKDILGHVTSGTGENAELHVIAASAPIVGVGAILQNRYKGVNTFEAYWIYKIQMASQGVSAETRRESTSFGHETISGDAVGVQLTSSGDIVFYAHKDGLTTEAAAVAWLKGKAGIT